jgi:hypothetical protein
MPANNSWTIGANPPVNRQYGAMTNLNDTLYLIGGFDDYYNYIPNHYYFYNDNDQYIPFGYGTVKPVQPQSFPTFTVPAVFGVLVAVVCVGLIYYLKPRHIQKPG